MTALAMNNFSLIDSVRELRHAKFTEEQADTQWLEFLNGKHRLFKNKRMI